MVGQLKCFLPIGRSDSGRFTWAQFWRAGWTEAKDEPVPLGVRYLSPFGPFRLDFAFPLDRRPDDPTSKVYIGFGSVF